jgi:hypothetical protein
MNGIIRGKSHDGREESMKRKQRVIDIIKSIERDTRIAPNNNSTSIKMENRRVYHNDLE